MRRRAIVFAILLSLATIAAPAAGGAGFRVEDRETVYGLLDAAGNPTHLEVVDWLRVYGQGTTVIFDPGDLTAVYNIKGPETPRKAAGGLSWRVRCRDGFKDIFYNGRTQRPLPLKIELSYTLNGKAVPAIAVAGARGDLAVTISLTNRLRARERLAYKDASGRVIHTTEEFTIPLAVSVTTDIPTARFRVIDAPEATATATGATLKLSWIVFPFPKTRLSLRLSGERLGLQPIYFSAVPKMLPLPPAALGDQLAGFYRGVTELDEACGAVASGAGEVARGQAQLASGIQTLQAGTADLSRLNLTHQEILGRTIAGLETLDSEAFSSSPDGLGTLEDGLARLEGGLGGLVQLNGAHRQIVASLRRELEAFDFRPLREGVAALGEMAKGLSDADRYLGGIAASHVHQAKLAGTARAQQDETAAVLARLTRAAPDLAGTPAYQELKRLVELQRLTLHDLADGGKDGGKAFEGMNHTSRTLEIIARKMGQGKQGVAELTQGVAKAGGLVAGLDRLREALKILAEGGRLDGKEIPGLDAAGEDLAGARDGLAAIGKELRAGGWQGVLAKAKEGLDRLRAALRVLLHGGLLEGQALPGLDAAGRGLTGLSDGLRQIADGIDRSATGAGELGGGLDRMRAQGIQPMRAGLAKAIAETAKGEALMQALSTRVLAYDHFIGKPAGATGEVRFLLRTEGLR